MEYALHNVINSPVKNTSNTSSNQNLDKGLTKNNSEKKPENRRPSIISAANWFKNTRKAKNEALNKKSKKDKKNGLFNIGFNYKI